MAIIACVRGDIFCAFRQIAPQDSWFTRITKGGSKCDVGQMRASCSLPVKASE